jgi:phosphoribosyl-ATP pyrophosphohydrolase
MILDDIYRVILDRRDNPEAGSYVAALFSRGKDEMLKKIGEESVEVIIASKSEDRQHTVEELADLWFHCLVLMARDGISHDDIFLELQKRFGRRGGDRP